MSFLLWSSTMHLASGELFGENEFTTSLCTFFYVFFNINILFNVKIKGENPLMHAIDASLQDVKFLVQ